MVLAFNDMLPVESRSYITRAAIAFGLISGASFLLFGLVGGFAGCEARVSLCLHLINSPMVKGIIRP
jgi:hypothetical protein